MTQKMVRSLKNGEVSRRKKSLLRREKKLNNSCLHSILYLNRTFVIVLVFAQIPRYFSLNIKLINRIGLFKNLCSCYLCLCLCYVCMFVFVIFVYGYFMCVCLFLLSGCSSSFKKRILISFILV